MLRFAFRGLFILALAGLVSVSTPGLAQTPSPSGTGMHSSGPMKVTRPFTTKKRASTKDTYYNYKRVRRETYKNRYKAKRQYSRSSSYRPIKPHPGAKMVPVEKPKPEKRSLWDLLFSF